MKSLRKRLTYANVMSSIAVFLVLGGASALAAHQLGKNTVGAKQLKKNAVTGVKIKKNAVTGAKIGAAAVTAAKLAPGAVEASKLANGSVTGEKIAGGAVGGGQLAGNSVTTGKLANGSVTGGKLANGSVTAEKIAAGSVTGAAIDSASTSFSRVVAKLRGSASVPFVSGQLYPLATPNYTQPAGEDDQYMASMDVTFPAGCTAPRRAEAFLLIDAVNPLTPGPGDYGGWGVVEDKGSGTVTRQMQFGVYLAPGAAMWRFAPPAATQHTFSILMLGSTCGSGSGITASGVGIDVIGTKTS